MSALLILCQVLEKVQIQLLFWGDCICADMASNERQVRHDMRSLFGLQLLRDSEAHPG